MLDVHESPPFATSRRGLLKLTGAAGAGMALAQMGALGALAQSNETVADIINIAATAEALAVSLFGAAIAGASKYDGGKGLSPMLVTYAKAIQAEEQDHYKFLTGAGAKALTLTFTIPQNLADITTSSTALMKFVVSAEEIFIGAYTAAGQEFTDLNQPTLVTYALEIASVEAQHRVLANYAAGAMPPNNLGFEKAPYASVGDAATVLKNLGLLGTSNPAATLNYNDFVGSIDYSGVSNQTPQKLGQG